MLCSKVGSERTNTILYTTDILAGGRDWYLPKSTRWTVKKPAIFIHQMQLLDSSW